MQRYVLDIETCERDSMAVAGVVRSEVVTHLQATLLSPVAQDGADESDYERWIRGG